MPPGNATGRRNTPLSAICVFTATNSLGTGLVTNGIFFLTKTAFGFSDVANFALGMFLGVAYVAGAAGAGPLLRRLPVSSHRSLLGVLMLGLAAMCTLPWLWRGVGGGTPPAWTVWVMVGLYSPMSGTLWPIVEAYVSGGRSGDNLRRTMGTWNVVWSGSLVAAYWGVAPFIEHRAVEAILALGLIHILSLIPLGFFGTAPAPHIHEDHEPHPPVFERLLVTFRMLLPTAYLVVSALSPYLASAMGRLEVAPQWQTVLASAWLVPRVAVFGALGFWQKWHGRWWPAVAGAALLLAGFGLCLLSAPAAAWGAGKVVAWGLMLAGLVLFGAGVGAIYSGAIYYAMEVGKAEVDAGGAHESLIGVGYTVGPACGLVMALLVRGGTVTKVTGDFVLLGTTGFIVLGVCAVVGMRVSRLARSGH